MSRTKLTPKMFRALAMVNLSEATALLSALFPEHLLTMICRDFNEHMQDPPHYLVLGHIDTDYRIEASFTPCGKPGTVFSPPLTLGITAKIVHRDVSENYKPTVFEETYWLPPEVAKKHGFGRTLRNGDGDEP